MTTSPEESAGAVSLPAYEKLGAFYLGRAYEPDANDGDGAVRDDLVMYDSKDLTTHAVCVGMTGSGKTGLGVSLIEEAAIDGVPVIAIDPKGDLGNLKLTFPKLRGGDFEPWIDPGAADRRGVTPGEYAESQADLWKHGLGKWGQDGSRIQRLRDAAEVSVYTPGSSAGRGLTPIKSLDPPKPGTPVEQVRERVITTASGLCSLLGLDADPIQSREHILLSSVLEAAWSRGRGLDLASLIGQIQNPPFAKVGVLDLDAFMPAKDRGALAMRINNLLASPGFAGWLEGEPMDVGKLLYTAEGRPRVSVLSIAHLGDAERMFFVTMVLGELIAWMRRQPGTGALRAVLYMDEVFGYFPPTANPPSKNALLTLMKQARAYGVGCVLATQNPVDLDYKGLSNAGTWLIGRLQTERDKARLMDGLESASSVGFDRGEIDRLISGLGKRVFLLHNVHERGGPVLFHTRWAMSYLRGPMTLAEIRKLRGNGPNEGEQRVFESETIEQDSTAASPPAVPAGVEVGYVPVSGSVRTGDRLVYTPALMSTGALHHVRTSMGLDTWTDVVAVAPAGEHADARSIWDNAAVVESKSIDLDKAADTRGTFVPMMPEITNKRKYTSWRRSLEDHLYRNRPVEMHACKKLKLVGEPGEEIGMFTARVRDAAHEKRDEEVEELRGKYAKKVQTLETRLMKAEQAIEREQDQARQARFSSVLTIGQSVLGVLLGRKKLSATNVNKAGTAARSAGRASQQKGDVARAEERAEAVRADLERLNEEAEREIDELRERLDPDSFEITTTIVAPRKGEIDASDVSVVWLPHRVDTDGVREPVYRLG
ncbi:MAG: DUF87 domain-containing protein [Phycisphaerales bacterium]